MEFKVEIFVASLKDELLHEVSPFTPKMIIEVKNLTLQQESKSKDLHKTIVRPQCPTETLFISCHSVPTGVRHLTLEEQVHRCEIGQKKCGDIIVNTCNMSDRVE